MIFVSGDFHPEALERLQQKHSVVCGPMVEIPANTEGLIIRSKTQVDKELLDQLPALKVICTATSGYDHIDLESCKKNKVVVAHTPEAAIASVAELTLFLALAALRKTATHLPNMREGNFRKGLNRAQTLSEKSWGIVGYGRIGKKVSEVIDPLVDQVLIYDPYEIEADIGFEDFLSEVDLLSLHVPLTRRTAGMLNKETLGKMKNTAILINVARGEIVVEADLIEALKDGTLAAAGLDVFENEPLAPESPLLQIPEVVLSPHVGAYTEQSFFRSSLQAAETLIDFFSSRPVSHLLPENAAWADQRMN